MMASTNIVIPPKVIIFYYFRNLVQQNDKSLMPLLMKVSHNHLCNIYISINICKITYNKEL